VSKKDSRNGRRQGNPVIDYVMVREDRETMARGIVESARIHVAAGARQVFSLHNRPCEIPYREGPIADAEVEGFAGRVRATESIGICGSAR
jgi:hypothetical protein